MYNREYFEKQRKMERSRKRKDAFWKGIISFGLLVVALIPTWIFLFVYHLTGPSTVMEKVAVIGLGVWIAGSFQVLLLIVWIFVIIQLIDT